MPANPGGIAPERIGNWVWGNSGAGLAKALPQSGLVVNGGNVVVIVYRSGTRAIVIGSIARLIGFEQWLYPNVYRKIGWVGSIRDKYESRIWTLKDQFYEVYPRAYRYPWRLALCLAISTYHRDDLARSSRL